MHIYIEFSACISHVLKQFENIQYTFMYHCLHKCTYIPLNLSFKRYLP